MPAPAHTPASRRFLPPTSSSQNRTQPTSAGRKPQFARPSQLPSSSPYVRTPFPRHSLREDDIEGSFEDRDGEDVEADTQQSPMRDQEPRRRNASREVKFIQDDDNNNNNNNNGLSDTEPVASDALQDTNVEEEDRRTITAIGHDNVYSSPLAKRQKRSHVPQYQDDPDFMSSSPSNRERRNTSIPHEDAMLLEDPLADRPSSELDNEPEPKSMFRLPARTQPSPPFKPSRLSSRIFLPNTSITTSHLAAPLPEAFSPSRKRGRRDYMKGGAADTLRGWVLDLANNEGRGRNGPHDQMRMTSVEKDRNGRFELMKDVDGTLWMMVRQQDTIDEAGKNENGESRSELVRLRGSGTTWSLELDDKRPLNVAVLWDKIT